MTTAYRFYWNESYERCKYDEAKHRFPEWLEEYKRDRAAHEKARSAHPDPTMLDAEFVVAFDASFCSFRTLHPDSPADDLGPLPCMRSLTEILLRGARATPGYFDDHELSGRNLGDVDPLLGRLGTRWAPGVEEFFDALAASGSMTMCTNRVYVGNGGESLWSMAFLRVTGQWDQGGTPLEQLLFRRASFRLLARMSFLSAERERAVGASHRFISLRPDTEFIRTVSIGGQSHHFPHYSLPWYPSNPDKHFGCRVRPENYDGILHVMYLAVFMYRHYPWPQRQQCRVDEDIARLLQDSHSGCQNGFRSYGCNDVVRSTMEMVTDMPGLFQALLEDDTLWLLLAARCCDEDECTTIESSFYFACVLQLVTRGRGMGRWSSVFRSRENERELTKTLKKCPEISTWLCGEVGRPVLLDICRQRRRRVVEVNSQTVLRWNHLVSNRSISPD